jgi:hypothetical protein
MKDRLCSEHEKTHHDWKKEETLKLKVKSYEEQNKNKLVIFSWILEVKIKK